METETAEMRAERAVVRSAMHGMFQLTRVYAAPVAQVWAALTEEGAKSQCRSTSPKGSRNGGVGSGVERLVYETSRD